MRPLYNYIQNINDISQHDFNDDLHMMDDPIIEPIMEQNDTQISEQNLDGKKENFEGE